MRGYSQWVLSRGMNFWPTAALLSCTFGAIHGSNPGEARRAWWRRLHRLFSLSHAAADGRFVVGRRFHMAWDWGESYLYSFRQRLDSPRPPAQLQLARSRVANGRLGWPGGSYLVFVVIGALWVLFARAYPEVKYSER